ncbi:haloacid dehalogenase-like hydrolase family member protein, putative [Babesia ovis]|uniref:Haloacid dehalogenase-like hydrolase family member protein, putative n=1 Tax=Babesia ovis TaxID=5869 RepID=A0A9W5TCC9_BABOV|nr:haloacid dehalogenase-like hydrolase family member protein, putative [Babesia ovis]
MKYRDYDYLPTLDPYDVKYFKILSVAIRHSNDLLKELHGFEGKYKTIPISLGYHKFVPPNVNKAFGIEQLMKYYGTTIKNCGAIGDNFNDIEMLTSCPQSYAVGNATDAAKDAAANVVDVRYDQAAFATVMKKLYGIDV